LNPIFSNRNRKQEIEDYCERDQPETAYDYQLRADLYAGRVFFEETQESSTGLGHRRFLAPSLLTLSAQYGTPAWIVLRPQ
jgi:hypothetical protein